MINQDKDSVEQARGNIPSADVQTEQDRANIPSADVQTEQDEANIPSADVQTEQDRIKLPQEVQKPGRDDKQLQVKGIVYEQDKVDSSAHVQDVIQEGVPDQERLNPRTEDLNLGRDEVQLPAAQQDIVQSGHKPSSQADQDIGRNGRRLPGHKQNGVKFNRANDGINFLSNVEDQVQDEFQFSLENQEQKGDGRKVPVEDKNTGGEDRIRLPSDVDNEMSFLNLFSKLNSIQVSFSQNMLIIN